jgi:tetratricopeptide (TPR) repeat protein
VKAVTNYAVTLEKLGKREDALKLLEGKTKRQFGQEIRVFNNLGIIHKRNGNTIEAEASYLAALEIDAQSFFPNYNLGVLKAAIKDYPSALQYFNKALELSRATQDEVYQINVHINIALVLERTNDLVGALSNMHIALNIDPLNQKLKAKID